MNAFSTFLAVAFIFAAACIGIWDVWVVASGRDSCTVSSIVGQWCHDYPLLSAAMGGLLIHLLTGRGGPTLPPIPPHVVAGQSLVFLGMLVWRLPLLLVFVLGLALALVGAVGLATA